ncbi:hypothetical protein KBC89_03490 [Candidatus Woesebacteria bacterium]|nr:hypothetical protein [Candidatus Woesebacteria bacterium]
MSFSIRIEGLDQLIKDADRAGGELPSLMMQTMVKAVTLVKNSAREIRDGSFKNRTGTLRRSITGDPQSASRGRVYVDQDYGIYVEEGTRPHTILPKAGKRFLAFKVDGRMVFARRVNHPGSKPYPFMEPAYRESAPKILEEYAKIGERLVATMAGK